MAKQSKNKEVKILGGGELGAYQTVISSEDSLRLWFQPILSGEVDDDTMDMVKDRIRLDITFIPFQGDPVYYSGSRDIVPSALNNKLFFGLKNEIIEDIIPEPVGDDDQILPGTIVIGVVARETEEVVEEVDGEDRVERGTLEAAATYRDLGVSREIEVADDAERESLHFSSVEESLNTMADRNDLNVNVLKPTFQKRALSILFKIIEDGTNRTRFKKYERYMNRIFCLGPGDDQAFNSLKDRRFLPFNDTDSYRVLKIATETFLMMNAGVCCDFSEIGSEDELIKYFADRDIRFAAGATEQFQSIWENYLQNEDDQTILPYLLLIRDKFGDTNITTTWIDEMIEKELCNSNGQDKEALKDRCFGIVRQRLQCPLFIELIWSYWQEEGMLVQGMNAIVRRFQNMKVPGKKDPLAEMEISHLRPLNNLLWGYIQDEQHRLTIIRRAYEYDHHYGIKLKGKAVSNLSSADSRTRFIESFHGFLNLAAKFYQDSTNKLVEPDTYPLLNALREIHFIIAEGMHNQYGDLPSTARIEMLMQQWILSRPEFREFLPGRAAIPFPELWMDRVAAMNRLQGWTDTSPIHFDYLAKYGEQILLGIRFGDWSNPDRSREDAALFVNHFREQIQGYINAYEKVAGPNLAVTLVGNQKVDTRQPSYHMAKRLRGRSNGQMQSTAQKKGVSIKQDVSKEW